MTQITGETVQRFLRDEGSLGIVDHEGIIRLLHVAMHEYTGEVQTANRLWHEGMWYSRDQFPQLFSKVELEVAVGD